MAKRKTEWMKLDRGAVVERNCATHKRTVRFIEAACVKDGCVYTAYMPECGCDPVDSNIIENEVRHGKA
jgi:hypothetical protein